MTCGVVRWRAAVPHAGVPQRTSCSTASALRTRVHPDRSPTMFKIANTPEVAAAAHDALTFLNSLNTTEWVPMPGNRDLFVRKHNDWWIDYGNRRGNDNRLLCFTAYPVDAVVASMIEGMFVF